VRSTIRPAWVAALVVAALAACGGKDDAGTAEGKAVEGDKPAEAAVPAAAKTVVEAWKDGDVAASDLTAGKAFGDRCATGTVDKLDIAICEFDNPKAAKAAEKQGYEWVGPTTGTAWVSGSLVIAVADRKKADPTGKTINRLMKLAPK